LVEGEEAAVAQRIDLYFDYGSPFAYFLSERILKSAPDRTVEIDWKPIDLHKLSNFEERMPYSDKKRQYVVLDAVRSAEFHGIAVQMPNPFPVRSGLALRAALVAQDAGVFSALHPLLFRAAWAEQKDIGEPDVIRDCLRRAGAEADHLVERAQGKAIERRLHSLTQEAESRGVFGVPTMFLGDEPFWGNDRLEMLEWRLRKNR
jgi:2-hydroxychromene-2-carboxylate isomerase